MDSPGNTIPSWFLTASATAMVRMDSASGRCGTSRCPHLTPWLPQGGRRPLPSVVVQWP
jgi:hypothetical protein